MVFTAADQCWSAASCAWGLEFSGFRMWQFLELHVGGFLWVLRTPLPLHRLMVSADEM